MPPLPVVSGREVARVLENFGWVFARQKGSHMAYKKEGCLRPVIVPNHNEVDRGTLKSILRESKISVEEFVEAL